MLPSILSLNSDKITPLLSTTRLGKNLVVLKSVPSTNEYLKEKARDGAKSGTAIIATEQTKGKGRLNRTFVSPFGKGIYLSVLLRDIQSSVLTQVIAVCVYRSLIKIYGIKPQIKWVNDLYLEDKKICGILVESAFAGGVQEFAIAGIGINLLPYEFDKTSACSAGSVGDFVIVTDDSAHRLIAEILNTLEFALDYGDTAEIMEEYKSNCLTLGKTVSYTVSGETRQGITTDIDGEGRLIVTRDDESCDILLSGEAVIKE